MLDSDVVLPQVDQQRLHSRTKPRGQDEKGAVAGTVAPTIKNEAWRDRFGSVRGRPVRRQSRQRDDQGRQEDRKTDGRGDGWEKGGKYGAGTSPAGALAHLPCCHTKGDTIRVGLKDGGEEGEGHGFFFLPHCGVKCRHPRRPAMGGPGQ